MIYYELVKRKKQKIEAVSYNAYELKRIEAFKKMKCEEKESVYAINTLVDEEFFESAVEWLENASTFTMQHHVYTFDGVSFPDGTTLYNYRALTLFAGKNPKSKTYSAVELMNIYVGNFTIHTPVYKDYWKTNWDPEGYEWLENFFTSPWPFNNPGPLPFPIPLPVPLPI